MGRHSDGYRALALCAAILVVAMGGGCGDAAPGTTRASSASSLAPSVPLAVEDCTITALPDLLNGGGSLRVELNSGVDPALWKPKATVRILGSTTTPAPSPAIVDVGGNEDLPDLPAGAYSAYADIRPASGSGPTMVCSTTFFVN